MCWGEPRRSRTHFLQGFRRYLGRWGQTVLVGGLTILLGCSAWKEPWTLSHNKLTDLCRPLQAKKEDEAFKTQVQKDPFPDASVLTKMSAQPPVTP